MKFFARYLEWLDLRVEWQCRRVALIGDDGCGAHE